MIQKTRTYILISFSLIVLLVGFYLFGLIRSANGTNVENNLNTFFPEPFPSSDSSMVTIAFTGDIMGHTPLIEAMYQPGSRTYDYHIVFQHVKEYFKQCDWVVGNLEVTLAGPPYTGYPNFSSPDALLYALIDAGYNTLTTANNHTYDKGKSGLIRTLNILDSLQMPHTGTYRDGLEHDQQTPFIWESSNGIRIALLNYTYGTNGIKVLKPNVVNMIDTAIMRQDLAKARENYVDFSIVSIHWGDEYQRKENATQQRIAQFAADHGADLIIGSHPHVLQPMKIITPGTDSTKHVPVFYSLGNFISNQRDIYRDGGIIAEVRLVKKAGSTYIYSMRYIPTWVYKKESIPLSFTIIPVSKAEAFPDNFKFSSADSIKLSRFASDTRLLLNNMTELKPEWSNDVN